MDSKLFQSMKYKISKLAPAIFADNMMMVVMSRYDVRWDYTFTTDEYYEKFFDHYGIDIVFDMEDIIQPWYESDSPSPAMWHFNEEALCKYLYFITNKFRQKSDEDVKTHFIIYCTIMIYFALDYYKRGVKSALTIVFLEVYFLACHFLERTNFKCDFLSAMDEF